ncbi:glycerol-3-phosphate responsive antiterminator [Thermovenabulum gondwanense]|uniref:Glycerol uptake operon antiterminator regulatory protein n=1 Tax=Thermovenabulum gondwanense TaxID=520767 RepID=A0A161PTR5_9FIRM|nr:glycerol-3-phosphate responsive antiterminator [Thermovenabulum gondwanense]KYO65347.1 Glycerol uptake operon antiterminator regulatory protein [Thermovenabulum gondwanense]
MKFLIEDLKSYPVIAAIRDIEKVDDALKERVKTIFLLTGSIFDIRYVVNHIKKAGRRVFIHFDLLDGISKDSVGIRYIAEEIKPDGIITTRTNLVSSAKSEGLFAIQRIFIVDSQAIDTAIKAINQVNPDAVEILPGIVYEAINKISRSIHYPLIAGGLIHEKEQVDEALKAGAMAISTSEEKLWNEVF